MLELTKTGLSREKSYKLVQNYAKKCFSENLDLFNVIQSDRYIMNNISQKLKTVFSYSKHFKNVNLYLEEFLNNEKRKKTLRRKSKNYLCYI